MVNPIVQLVRRVLAFSRSPLLPRANCHSIPEIIIQINIHRPVISRRTSMELMITVPMLSIINLGPRRLLSSLRASSRLIWANACWAEDEMKARAKKRT